MVAVIVNLNMWMYRRKMPNLPLQQRGNCWCVGGCSGAIKSGSGLAVFSTELLYCSQRIYANWEDALCFYLDFICMWVTWYTFFLCSMKSVRTLVLLCNPVIPYTLTLRSSSTCKHSGYIHFCYLCNKECQSLSGLNVTTSPPSHSYIAFDFHKECSRMRWDRLQILVDSVAETQDEYR